MKKTMNINIAGQLFRIDEDAYEILTRYLEHVSSRFLSEQGGEETVSDIEARIAEIFGGGNEPPTLVSKEMVKEMINIMGAPEDYYDEIPAGTDRGNISYTRKAMYDPNSPSARIGKALSEFFKAFGRLMSAVLRVFAVIFGTVFTVIGFILLFSFVFVIFFNNAPFIRDVMEPQLTNIHTLLSVVLNSSMVVPIMILTGMVILMPLGALIYLGIAMIFRIRKSSKIFGLVMFLTWIAAACALAVFLSLQLSVYSTHEKLEERKNLDNPPDTLYIAPGRMTASIGYDDYASVDNFSLFLQSSPDRLFGSVDLNIYSSDTTSGFISVEKRACSHSGNEAWANARAIEYNWKLSSDTLILDEFYSLPEDKDWNGSTVDIDVRLPEGSVVRFLNGMDPEKWGLHIHNPYVSIFRVTDWGVEAIEE